MIFVDDNTFIADTKEKACKILEIYFKECERLGYIDKDRIVRSMVTGDGWQLDMPPFTKKEVQSLCKTFNLYVRFPKSRWPDIQKAEADTPEGNKIYKELKEEFIEKFWNNSVSFESSAAEFDPMAAI